jgi:hypothetical protein
MKKCSTPLAIKERQIKMTLRFYLTPVRMAIVKKTKTIAGANTLNKLEQTLWKSVWKFLKKLKIDL